MADVLALAPALKQLPLVEVPSHRADGEWGSALLLGSAWQSVAVDLALSRHAEALPWWESLLAAARYTNLPAGLLAAKHNPHQVSLS